MKRMYSALAGFVALSGLLVGLVGHSCVANAAALGYAPNQANGMIVLTDEQSNCPSFASYAYQTDAGGVRTLGACYVVQRDLPFVYLRWSNETETRQYPIESFSLTGAGRARAAAHASN